MYFIISKLFTRYLSCTEWLFKVAQASSNSICSFEHFFKSRFCVYANSCIEEWELVALCRDSTALLMCKHPSRKKKKLRTLTIRQNSKKFGTSAFFLSLCSLQSFSISKAFGNAICKGAHHVTLQNYLYGFLLFNKNACSESKEQYRSSRNQEPLLRHCLSVRKKPNCIFQG